MMIDRETEDMPEESLNTEEVVEELVEEDNVMDDLASEQVTGEETNEGSSLSLEDQLRLDLVEANEAKLRALADFKNFQRRSLDNEMRAVSGGMARVVRSILPAIEQMNMAIEHASEGADDDAVVQGFQMARDELLRGMLECGVTQISPEVGDSFDPQFHEAMMRQDAEGLEADHIVMVMQSGFRLGDIVISPAKVSVSS